MATMAIDGIPVFRALVDAEDSITGILRVSLVDAPAVESNFVAFDRQRKMQTYSVKDEAKRLVLGVVMRADFPIYRRDPQSGEYYIVYTADTIRTMAEKYLVQGRQNEVNTMHQPGSDVADVDMVQWFIKDTDKGINPVGFEEIADGSLFAEYHINNDEVWEAITKGEYKGFSLEGVFDLVPEKDSSYVEQIESTLFRAVCIIKPNIKNMSKIKGLMARLARALVEMGTTTTDKGILAWDGEEDLKAGDSVFIEDAEGERVKAEDGDYKTTDGKVIVVVDGAVSEIKDAEAEVAPEGEAEAETEAAEETKFASVETDKGILEWEGEGDLEAGADVFITDAEGNRNPAPDGDYVTADGKTIVVAEGKVSEIKDAEAEVEPEVDAEKETLRAENEELRTQNESLRAEVDELKAKVQELSKEPAGKEAHEDYKSAITPGKTGNKGVDRIAKYMGAE